MAVLAGQYDLCRGNEGAARIVSAALYLQETSGTPLRLIAIDTISRALCGGDENSPKDMGALVGNLDAIQARTNYPHILTVHHIPADGQQRLRGHGALLGGMDVTARVEKVGNVRTAAVDKMNDGDPGEPISFDIASVDLHHDETSGITTTAPVVIPAATVTAPAKRGAELTKNQRTMLSILFDAHTGLTVEEWNARAREAGIGVSRKADLYDARASLKAKRLVHERGDQWVAARS
jgi:hypothetical protein